MSDIFDFSLLEQGGLVMWPLLLVSLFGFVTFIERTLYLHKGQIRTETFIAGLKNLLRKRRLVEALTVCEETPGPVVNVVKAALLHYDEPAPKMRGAVQTAALIEIPNLERRVGAVAVVAKLAPLLGLLGTLLGAFQVFREMQAEGAYAHFGVLNAGIGEALLSSIVGLGIAIMAWAGHAFLVGRVRAVVHDMESAGHQIMEYLLHELPAEDAEDDDSSVVMPTARSVEVESP